MLCVVLGPGTKEEVNIDTQFLSVYPLSALIEQSLALPILTQYVLRYFVPTVCYIYKHFTMASFSRLYKTSGADALVQKTQHSFTLYCGLQLLCIKSLYTYTILHNNCF